MNLYDILDVDSRASQVDIVAAYRKLVKQYHPDRNPGDEKAAEMFKQVQAAYEVLIDDVKRQYYDETGEIPKQMQDAEDETDAIIQNLLWKALATFNVYGDFQWGRPSQQSSARTILDAMLQQLTTSIGQGEQQTAQNLNEMKKLAKLSTEFSELEDKLIFECLCGKIETLKRENEEILKGINSLKKAYDRLKKQNPKTKQQFQSISATTY